jgi:hypothetical protein
MPKVWGERVPGSWLLWLQTLGMRFWRIWSHVITGAAVQFWLRKWVVTAAQRCQQQHVQQHYRRAAGISDRNEEAICSCRHNLCTGTSRSSRHDGVARAEQQQQDSADVIWQGTAAEARSAGAAAAAGWLGCVQLLSQCVRGMHTCAGMGATLRRERAVPPAALSLSQQGMCCKQSSWVLDVILLGQGC